MSSTGYIYKLTSPNSNMIYIGSTCNSLSKRRSAHMCQYRRYSLLSDDNRQKYVSSFDLIKLGDIKIELIEEVKTDNNIDLRNKEREHILKNKDICMNKSIPNRSPREWYIDNASNIKAKYQINKEKIKQYYEDNKQHYKDYYILNRDNKIKYQKEYNKLKKDKLFPKTEIDNTEKIAQVHDKP